MLGKEVVNKLLTLEIMHGNIISLHPKSFRLQQARERERERARKILLLTHTCLASMFVHVNLGCLQQNWVAKGKEKYEICSLDVCLCVSLHPLTGKLWLWGSESEFQHPN